MKFEVVAIPVSQAGKTIGEAEDCKVEKFSCAGTIVPVAEMSAHEFKYFEPLNATSKEDKKDKRPVQLRVAQKCKVQTRCGTKNYGFEVFDFDCKSQRLLCNGTLVDSAHVNETTVSDSCVLVNSPCQNVTSETEVCNSIKTTCPSASPFDDVCLFSTRHKRICTFLSTPPICLPRTITCLGTDQVYPSQLEPLSVCENVKSIQCSDIAGQIQTGDANTICRVVAMHCIDPQTGQYSPTRVPFGSQPAIPKNCSVSEVLCAPLDAPVACTLHKFGCEKPCHYVASAGLCEDQCVQVGLEPKCRCPADRKGRDCEDLVPMNCKLDLVYPLKSCPTSVRTEVPVCVELQSTDSLQLRMNLSCTLQGVKVDPRELSNDGFNYTLVTTNLALSEKIEDYWIRAKIFNFNQLSDDTHVEYVQVTPAHFLSVETLSFKLDIPSLDLAKYAIGNRIYAEYRLENIDFKALIEALNGTKAEGKNSTKKQPPVPQRPLIPKTVAKELFDLMDLPEIPGRTEDETVYWVIFGLALAVVLGIGGYFFYRWRLARRVKVKPSDKKL